MKEYDLTRKMSVEFLGTFWLVFGGCGSAVFAAAFPQGTFAPIAIGLTLTLIHLVSIPVTNTSVNPARSIGPAIFVGGWAISQLWLFVAAPIVGAFLAGTAHRLLTTEREAAELDPTLARAVT